MTFSQFLGINMWFIHENWRRGCMITSVCCEKKMPWWCYCVTQRKALKPNLTQHACTCNYWNIVGSTILHTFGHPVVICCDMLGVVGSNLTNFKLEPTTPNVAQQAGQTCVTQLMCSTMLQDVVLQSCDCLAGADFKHIHVINNVYM